MPDQSDHQTRSLGTLRQNCPPMVMETKLKTRWLICKITYHMSFWVVESFVYLKCNKKYFVRPQRTHLLHLQKTAIAAIKMRQTSPTPTAIAVPATEAPDSDPFSSFKSTTSGILSSPCPSLQLPESVTSKKIVNMFFRPLLSETSRFGTNLAFIPKKYVQH